MACLGCRGTVGRMMARSRKPPKSSTISRPETYAQLWTHAQPEPGLANPCCFDWCEPLAEPFSIAIPEPNFLIQFNLLTLQPEIAELNPGPRALGENSPYELSRLSRVVLAPNA